MIHDSDANVFAQPQPTTDVFDWLSGEGFVMVRNQIVQKMHELPNACIRPADPIPSVADEVRVLEGWLR